MSILDNIKSLFAGPRSDPMATWLYVRCRRCGTPLAVRVDLRNEPSIDYDTGGYVLHKDMMDDKCFALMHAEIHFDARRMIVEKKLDGGEFLTQAQYEAMTNQAATHAK